MVKRCAAVVAIAAVAVVMSASGASAHPLGNFSINRYAGITIGTDEVRVDYVVDYAELPTYQLRDRYRRDAAAFARDSCPAIARDLVLELGGRAVALHAGASDATVHDGQAGLSTLRLDCDL